jgi:hypothetical protein
LRAQKIRSKCLKSSSYLATYSHNYSHTPGTGDDRRQRQDERSLFSATLCCSLNNLSDSRWPPKSLRRRERHANRGLKSWVQKQAEKAPHLQQNSAVSLSIPQLHSSAMGRIGRVEIRYKPTSSWREGFEFALERRFKNM